MVGLLVGEVVGPGVGDEVGLGVGAGVGEDVGVIVGANVGLIVGEAVGPGVGAIVGSGVGEGDGRDVGVEVGASAGFASASSSLEVSVGFSHGWGQSQSSGTESSLTTTLGFDSEIVAPCHSVTTAELIAEVVRFSGTIIYIIVTSTYPRWIHGSKYQGPGEYEVEFTVPIRLTGGVGLKGSVDVHSECAEGYDCNSCVAASSRRNLRRVGY